MPWNRKRDDPSQGRLKCGQAHRRSQCNFALAPNHASLRDATAFVHGPGNELPGYYRSVPTGQIRQNLGLIVQGDRALPVRHSSLTPSYADRQARRMKHQTLGSVLAPLRGFRLANLERREHWTEEHLALSSWVGQKGI
jgi:hypothetical protein